MTRPPLDEEAEAKIAARKSARAKKDASTQAFLERFASASERGAALAVVAYLDTKVTDFTKRMFVDGSVTENMLAVENGPLGTLGVKVGICFICGWLTRTTYDDLKAIIKIRNLFAHHLEVDSFSHDKVAAHCKNLSLFKDQAKFFGSGEDANYQIGFYREFGYDLHEHKWGFMAAVGFLSNKFQTNSHTPKHFRMSYVRPLF